MLLQRLKSAGAENLVRQSQFGFKSKVGTREALFVMRLVIENIQSSKMALAFSLPLIGPRRSIAYLLKGCCWHFGVLVYHKLL